MAVNYNYYLGPWVWQSLEVDQEEGWIPPTGTVGSIDLRPLATMIQKQTLGTKPWGFFAVNGTLPNPYELLGSGDMRDINLTNPMKNKIENFTGYRPTGSKLVDAIWELLTVAADPDGIDGPKPIIQGTFDTPLELAIHGHSVVKKEKFKWGNHYHTDVLKTSIQRDFDKIFHEYELINPDVPRRYLSCLMRKYKIKEWQQFIPRKLLPHVEGPIRPHTVITESFNTADSDTLGPDLTWTESGDVDIVGNRARYMTLNATDRARADTDLSDIDQYSKNVAQVAGGTNTNTQTGVSAAVRKDSTATNTSYFARRSKTSANNAQLYKIVSGTATQLGSNVSVSVTPPFTIRCECNANTIRCIIDSTTHITQTDTAISTGFRTEIRNFQGSSATRAEIDDFEAGDLAGRIIYDRLNPLAKSRLRL